MTPPPRSGRTGKADRRSGVRQVGGGTVRANAYALMSRAVEEGVLRGWNRAHKHNDKPDQFSVCGEVEKAVMDAICEWFVFEEFA